MITWSGLHFYRHKGRTLWIMTRFRSIEPFGFSVGIVVLGAWYNNQLGAYTETAF